jgi:hypothetical protein
MFTPFAEGGKPPFHTYIQFFHPDVQYRMVRYHIPYGTIPIPYGTIPYTRWYFSLPFSMVFLPPLSTPFLIFMFWLSLSCQLSLSGIYTWREVHNNPPPWDNNQTNSHFPPRWTFHPLSTRVLTLLLLQHPTPLNPPAYWHNKCLMAPVLPVLPPQGALPVSTPPFLGPAPPPLCYTP